MSSHASFATHEHRLSLAEILDVLVADGDPRRLVDVQWVTPHLATLGAREVPRAAYLGMLADALEAPLPTAWR